MRNSYSFAVDVENALCGHEEPFRAFSSVYTSGQKRSPEKMLGIVAGKMTRRRIMDRLAPHFSALQISRVWTPRKPK